MPNNKAIRSGTLAACLLASTGGVAAQANSSASISDFGYELVDLAPDDGVAPSMSLTPTRIVGESILYLQTFSIPLAEASTSTFGALSVDNAYGSASATLAPDYAASSTADAQAYSSRAGTWVELDFVLSPNTRVIFSANGSVNALPANGYSSTEASLNGEITTPFISHGTRFGASVYSMLGEESRLLSAVANSDAEELAGTMSIRTGAWAESYVPPIPEPGQAAMLLAGLALVGGAGLQARRRGCRRAQGITASG